MEDRFSPLMATSIEGHIECIKILLSAGANALYMDIIGVTALKCAIHCKHAEVEAVLRAHIANLEAAERERVGG